MLITPKPKPTDRQQTFLYEGPDEITVRLYTRWYQLRKHGREIGEELVPQILQEGPAMWTYSNPSDPWGSRTRVSVEELERLVTLAEVKVAVMGIKRKETMSAKTSDPSITLTSEERKTA